MQLRYLGDSHDYLKFALLRHLQGKLDLRIGVNWYLTNPENNGDGEQRQFLDRPEWKCLDEGLYEKLRPYLNREYRTLKNFERDQILPENTLYYREKVRCKAERAVWHKEAISTLSEAGLIFMDQDNGFEVESMTDLTQAKYALYKEAFDYYRSGKIVIGIQFAGRRNLLNLANEVRTKFIQTADCSTHLSVVRGRVTPNILFFSICPLGRVQTIEKALESFAARNPAFRDRKTRKDARRAELIP